MAIVLAIALWRLVRSWRRRRRNRRPRDTQRYTPGR
jgi:peptidoglycan/LPS O-acetylase OafA/YrhL